jgi:hypothetical protein
VLHQVVGGVCHTAHKLAVIDKIGFCRKKYF